MLAPHELKNKSFSKSVRGYNQNEVDDYIEFLIEKYTELYRENDELERKLKVVVTNLDEIRDEEESIRSTLVKAQQMGEKIIRDANEKADVITDSIKTRCESIIAEFRRQYAAERKEVWQLRNTVLDFKKNVYELYREHIEELQAISVNDLEQLVIPEDTEVVGRILGDVKHAVESQVNAGEDIKRESDLNVADKHVSAPEPEAEAEEIKEEPVIAETDASEEVKAPEITESKPEESTSALDFTDLLDLK